jgi:hypothetical protein
MPFGALASRPRAIYLKVFESCVVNRSGAVPPAAGGVRARVGVRETER